MNFENLGDHARLRPPTRCPLRLTPTRSTTGAATDATDDSTSPAEAGSSTDPINGDVIEEEDEIAAGSDEEAKTKGTTWRAFPRSPFCEACLKAKAQRKPNKEHPVVLEPDAAPREATA